MVSVCCIPTCPNSKTSRWRIYENVSFHRLPTDLRLRAEWEKILQGHCLPGKLDNEDVRICSLHFKEEFFEKKSRLIGSSSRRSYLLQNDAVPTLNLGKCFPKDFSNKSPELPNLKRRYSETTNDVVACGSGTQEKTHGEKRLRTIKPVVQESVETSLSPHKTSEGSKVSKKIHSTTSNNKNHESPTKRQTSHELRSSTSNSKSKQPDLFTTCNINNSKLSSKMIPLVVLENVVEKTHENIKFKKSGIKNPLTTNLYRKRRKEELIKQLIKNSYKFSKARTKQNEEQGISSDDAGDGTSKSIPPSSPPRQRHETAREEDEHVESKIIPKSTRRIDQVLLLRRNARGLKRESTPFPKTNAKEQNDTLEASPQKNKQCDHESKVKKHAEVTPKVSSISPTKNLSKQEQTFAEENPKTSSPTVVPTSIPAQSETTSQKDSCSLDETPNIESSQQHEVDVINATVPSSKDGSLKYDSLETVQFSPSLNEDDSGQEEINIDESDQGNINRDDSPIVTEQDMVNLLTCNESMEIDEVPQLAPTLPVPNVIVAKKVNLPASINSEETNEVPQLAPTLPVPDVSVAKEVNLPASINSEETNEVPQLAPTLPVPDDVSVAKEVNLPACINSEETNEVPQLAPTLPVVPDVSVAKEVNLPACINSEETNEVPQLAPTLPVVPDVSVAKEVNLPACINSEETNEVPQLAPTLPVPDVSVAKEKTEQKSLVINIQTKNLIESENNRNQQKNRFIPIKAKTLLAISSPGNNIRFMSIKPAPTTPSGSIFPGLRPILPAQIALSPCKNFVNSTGNARSTLNPSSTNETTETTPARNVTISNNMASVMYNFAPSSNATINVHDNDIAMPPDVSARNVTGSKSTASNLSFNLISITDPNLTPAVQPSVSIANGTANLVAPTNATTDVATKNLTPSPEPSATCFKNAVNELVFLLTPANTTANAVTSSITPLPGLSTSVFSNTATTYVIKQATNITNTTSSNVMTPNTIMLLPVSSNTTNVQQNLNSLNNVTNMQVVASNSAEVATNTLKTSLHHKNTCDFTTESFDTLDNTTGKQVTTEENSDNIHEENGENSKSPKNETEEVVTKAQFNILKCKIESLPTISCDNLKKNTDPVNVTADFKEETKEILSNEPTCSSHHMPTNSAITIKASPKLDKYIKVEKSLDMKNYETVTTDDAIKNENLRKKIVKFKNNKLQVYNETKNTDTRNEPPVKKNKFYITTNEKTCNKKIKIVTRSDIVILKAEPAQKSAETRAGISTKMKASKRRHYEVMKKTTPEKILKKMKTSTDSSSDSDEEIICQISNQRARQPEIKNSSATNETTIETKTTDGYDSGTATDVTAVDATSTTASKEDSGTICHEQIRNKSPEVPDLKKTTTNKNKCGTESLASIVKNTLDKSTMNASKATDAVSNIVQIPDEVETCSTNSVTSEIETTSKSSQTPGTSSKCDEICRETVKSPENSETPPEVTASVILDDCSDTITDIITDSLSKSTTVPNKEVATNTSNVDGNQDKTLKSSAVDNQPCTQNESPAVRKVLSKEEMKQVNDYTMKLLLSMLLGDREWDKDFVLTLQCGQTPNIHLAYPPEYELPNLDIFLHYGKETISFENLVSPNSEDPVRLAELYQSYKQIFNENLAAATPALVTNRKIEHTTLDPILQKSDEITSFVTMRAQCFKDQFDGKESIVQRLANTNESSTQAETFLQTLQIFSGQDEESLKSLCMDRLKLELLNDTQSSIVYSMALSWLTQHIGIKAKVTLSSNVFYNFIDELISQMNSNFKFSPPRDYFTVESDLDRADKALSLYQGTRMMDLIVCGGSAVGKSDFVKRYLKLNEEKFHNIIVLQSNSGKSLVESLKEAAKHFGIVIKELPQFNKDRSKQIVDKLLEYFMHRNTVIFFDNADNIESREILSHIFSNTTRIPGPIIITTSKVPIKSIPYMKLENYKKNQAIQFLNENIEEANANKESHRKLLEQLAEHLMMYPFPMKLASACINNEMKMLKKSNRESRLTKCINGFVCSESLDPIYKEPSEKCLQPLLCTWLRLKEVLRKEDYGNIALQIFQIMMFMESDNINTNAFTLMYEIQQASEKLKMDAKEIVQKAINNLNKYKLLVNIGGRTSVHRALKQVVIMDICNLSKVESFVLQRAVGMIDSDYKPNMKNYDLKATNFTPEYLLYWFNFIKECIRRKEVILKYHHLIPRLMMDLFHNNSLDDNTKKFEVAIFQSILSSLQQQLKGRTDSKEIKRSIIASKLQIARILWFDESKEIRRHSVHEFIESVSKMAQLNEDVDYAYIFRASYELDRLYKQNVEPKEEIIRNILDCIKNKLSTCHVLLTDDFSRLIVLEKIAFELSKLLDYKYESAKLYYHILKKRSELREEGYKTPTPISNVLTLLNDFDETLWQKFDEKSFKEEEVREFMTFCLQEAKLCDETQVEIMHSFLHYVRFLEEEDEDFATNDFSSAYINYLCIRPNAFNFLIELCIRCNDLKQHELAIRLIEAMNVLSNLNVKQKAVTKKMLYISVSLQKPNKRVLSPREDTDDLWSIFGKEQFISLTWFFKSLMQLNQSQSVCEIVDRMWTLKSDNINWKNNLLSALKKYADRLFDLNQIANAWGVYKALICKLKQLGVICCTSHEFNLKSKQVVRKMKRNVEETGISILVDDLDIPSSI